MHVFGSGAALLYSTSSNGATTDGSCYSAQWYATTNGKTNLKDAVDSYLGSATDCWSNMLVAVAEGAIFVSSTVYSALFSADRRVLAWAPTGTSGSGRVAFDSSKVIGTMELNFAGAVVARDAGTKVFLHIKEGMTTGTQLHIVELDTASADATWAPVNRYTSSVVPVTDYASSGALPP